MIKVSLLDIRKIYDYDPFNVYKDYRDLLKAKSNIKADEKFPLSDIIYINDIWETFYIMSELNIDALDVAAIFNIWCSEKVVTIYNKLVKNDTRVSEAIHASKLYLNDKIDKNALLCAKAKAIEASQETKYISASRAALCASNDGLSFYSSSDASIDSLIALSEYVSLSEKDPVRNRFLSNQEDKLKELLDNWEE